MIQKALVLKTFPNKTAEISVQRQSACGGNCSGCEGCSFRENEIRVTAENIAGAAEGQKVLVQTKTRLIFRYAVLVYILPVIFLVIGYAAAFMLSLSEPICILTGFLALLAGSTVVIVFQRKKKDEAPSYYISTVLEE